MSIRASHLLIGDKDLEIWDTVARNGIGAPAVAGTVAAMTDTSKVYVYTGSESGYTAGNWYYYNGSAWVSGGVYNSTAFETDETLTEQGAAADAKAVGDAIADIQSALVNKANVDGAYEQMTVGNAEQLVSNVGIEDSVPYNFRTSGGSADIGDRADVKKVVGVSLPWNQLVQNGNFADTTGWTAPRGNISASSNELTYSVTELGGGSQNRIQRDIPSVPAGHKVLVSVDWNPAHSHDLKIMYWASNLSYIEKKVLTTMTAGAWNTGSCIITNATDASTNIRAGFDSTSGDVAVNDADKVRNFVLFDLTQMFGSTIADYVYTLETANAGAGVAWFRKLFPKPYYAYNAGELMSVQTSAHKMVGFNAWDEQWELGAYDPNTGEKVVNNNAWRSTNYIPIVGGQTYYFYGNFTTSGSQARIFWYDGAKNFISMSQKWNDAVLAPPYACFCTFRIEGTHASTTEACINLSWDGERNGEYEEYKQWVYPLDSDLTLRGIPKLSSGNDLYYDGDTYESDGTVKRRFAVKVLNGTEDWKGADSSGHCWVQDDSIMRSSVSGIPYTQMMISNVRVAASSYSFGTVTEPMVSAWGATSSGTDNYWYFAAPNVKDTAVAIKAYLAQHPVTVVYMLATPTTESADPYQNPQIVEDFGTEEYVDERTVAIPVGHETFYQANLKAKLEMAPNSPDGDGDYVVRQTNGVNEYVPLLFPASSIPAAPSENGTYTLTVTVSDGTATYSWVANS